MAHFSFIFLANPSFKQIHPVVSVIYSRFIMTSNFWLNFLIMDLLLLFVSALCGLELHKGIERLKLFQYYSMVNKSIRIIFKTCFILQGEPWPDIVLVCKWIFSFQRYSDGHNAKKEVIAFWIPPYYWATHWSRGLNRDTGKYRSRLRAGVRSMSWGLDRARHISRAIDKYKQSSQSQQRYLSFTVPSLFFISGNSILWHWNFHYYFFLQCMLWGENEHPDISCWQVLSNGIVFQWIPQSRYIRKSDNVD